MTRTIRELMTEGPRTATPDDDVATVARWMRDEDAGALPVVEGDRLVGMLTDRDVVVRVVAEGRDPASTRVGEVASRRLVTVDPQQDADEALRLMAQHQVRRLPVVEEDGKLVGMIAQADMAREADPTSVGEAVDRISR
jgi:CBS domain-containing protein